MSDWIELNKDDLPADILSGKYKFRTYTEDGLPQLTYDNAIHILHMATRGDVEISYKFKPWKGENANQKADNYISNLLFINTNLKGALKAEIKRAFIAGLEASNEG